MDLWQEMVCGLVEGGVMEIRFPQMAEKSLFIWSREWQTATVLLPVLPAPEKPLP